MTRLAALLILLSQLLLLWLALDTTGTTAIAFSFVGAPALTAGLALAAWSLYRRRQAERHVDT
jgi:LPXTG-motif cell wall-anchored protein